MPANVALISDYAAVIFWLRMKADHRTGRICGDARGRLRFCRSLSRTGKRGKCFVGVDIGGTFTDLVVSADGQLRIHKLLSTPGDPAEAMLDGLTAVSEGIWRCSSGSRMGRRSPRTRFWSARGRKPP